MCEQMNIISRQQEKSVTPSIFFDLDLHIFSKNNLYYAFDVRNFSILRLNYIGSAVLSRMRNSSLESIVEELSGSFSPDLIRAHYLKFFNCIQNKTFSTKPLPLPKRPKFYRLVLMLAGGCNLGCLYCFEKDVPISQNQNLLTLEQAQKTLEWFYRYHEGEKAHIELYGGEPLLNWPVLKYVVENSECWAKQNNIHLTFYMITNGTLLDTDKITYLNKHDVTIQVSVDGDPDTHDSNRVYKSGKPTMATIKPNIDKLIKQGSNFNLRAVLTSKNKNPKMIMSALQSYGAQRVSFEVVATDNPNAQLDKEDWVDFIHMNKQYTSGPIETWIQLPDEIKKTIIKLCECRRSFFGCGAGLSEVTVAPDGHIYECQRFHRKPYSKILDDRGPVDLNSNFLTAVDDRAVCKDCWSRYVCGGGCMHQAHTGIKNQITKSTPSSHSCDLTKREFDSIYPVESPRVHSSTDPLVEFCVMKKNIVEESILKICELKNRMRE